MGRLKQMHLNSFCLHLHESELRFIYRYQKTPALDQGIQGKAFKHCQHTKALPSHCSLLHRTP